MFSVSPVYWKRRWWSFVLILLIHIFNFLVFHYITQVWLNSLFKVLHQEMWKRTYVYLEKKVISFTSWCTLLVMPLLWPLSFLSPWYSWLTGILPWNPSLSLLKQEGRFEFLKFFPKKGVGAQILPIL